MPSIEPAQDKGAAPHRPRPVPVGENLSLGLRAGLEQGFREFLLVGGFGGRLDHTVANLQALGWLCRQGASGQILSNRNRAWGSSSRGGTGVSCLPALPQAPRNPFPPYGNSR